MIKKLFHIEYIKTLSLRSFKTLISLHFLLFIVLILIGSYINVSIAGFSFKNLYQFPFIWEFFTWIASWFNILLVIVIIVLTGNEYNFKTNRLQIINSLNRDELFIGKGILIFFISVYTLILVLISSLIFGFIYTQHFTFEIFFQKSHLLLLYFLQTISFMCLGLFFIVLLRNTALSIVLFILYRIIIEPILRYPFSKEIRNYFPSKIISSLTPFPKKNDIVVFDMINMDSIEDYNNEISLFIKIGLVIIYLILFALGTRLILKNQDF